MKITTTLLFVLFVFQTMAQEPAFNEKIIVETSAFTTEKIQMKDGSYFFTTGHITGTVVTFHVYRFGPDGKKIFEKSNRELGAGVGKYAMVYNKEQDDAILVILGKAERGSYPVTIIRFENNNSHIMKTTTVKSQIASVIFANGTLYLMGVLDIPTADRVAVVKYDLYKMDYGSMELTSSVMNMPKLEERKNTYYYSPVDVDGSKILFARALSTHTDKSTSMGTLNLLWYDIATNTASEPVVNAIDVSDKLFMSYLTGVFTTQQISSAFDVLDTPLFTKNEKDGSYVFYSGYKIKKIPVSTSESNLAGDFILKVSKDLKKEWMTFIPYDDKLAKNASFIKEEAPRKRFQTAYFDGDEILLETNGATSKNQSITLLHHINKKDGKLVKTESDATANLLPMMIRYTGNADFKQAMPGLSKVISGYQNAQATFDFHASEKYFYIHNKEVKKGYEIYAIPLKK